MEITIPIEKRMINALLLHSSFIDNLGLLNGKMGIAIFFFHLAKETENSIYSDYADELVADIYNEISLSTPVDFENGLAGIGWGLCYLIEKGFIETDSDKMFSDIDKNLFEAYCSSHSENIREITGYGFYLLKRVRNATDQKSLDAIVNKQHLTDIIEKLDNILRIDELRKEPEMFDLLWDYPLLIVFLSEMLQLNLMPVRVQEIITRILKPVSVDEKLPERHSNRLLLTLALTKTASVDTKSLGLLCKPAIRLLSTGIDRDVISKELKTNCAFMQHGTIGISFLYKQLFLLTGEVHYETEAKWWMEQSFRFPENDQGYAGFFIGMGEEPLAFGLLNGLAGLSLFALYQDYKFV